MMSRFKKVKEFFYKDHHVEIHKDSVTGKYNYLATKDSLPDISFPGKGFVSSIKEAIRRAKHEIRTGDGEY